MRRPTGTRARRARPRWRVGVLDYDSRSRGEVSRSIEERGGLVVVDSPPRADALELVRRVEPDAVVLAAEDEMDEAEALTGPLTLGASAPLVLLTSSVSTRTLRVARACGVMGVLLRPLRPVDVAPTLDLAIARFRDLRRLRLALADRPVVEQAKARLMRDGLSEPAAFGWLRRRAMDRRVRIGEVARTVLAEDGLRA
ncbi:MAG TPA: ANTAR domain-containing protein [Methylomirabilota bacterium]|nr:ANTAR domain-containing protein [Methylomirabilota bacterium]